MFKKISWTTPTEAGVYTNTVTGQITRDNEIVSASTDFVLTVISCYMSSD